MPLWNSPLSLPQEKGAKTVRKIAVSYDGQPAVYVPFSLSHTEERIQKAAEKFPKRIYFFHGEYPKKAWTA